MFSGASFGKDYWKVVSQRVTIPFVPLRCSSTIRFLRVGLFGNAALTGGKFLLKLNISEKPIAHKYCEGKVKRTLKRGLKLREIVKREPFWSVIAC